MNYIKKIRIENFESHVDTKLDFNEGVNVIIGESDTGKSSIFRAINLVLKNRPLGYAFKPKGSPNNIITKVTLELTDGTIVERIRSKTQNIYTLDGIEFKAFGTDPPEEVIEAISISPNINIQNQGDPFFLLQNSPGDVAKHLNKVAKFEVIDSCHHKSEVEQRRIKNELRQQEKQLEENTIELNKYNRIEEAVGISHQIETLDNKIDDLVCDIDDWVDTDREYEKALQGLTGFDTLDKANSLFDKLQSIVEKKSKYEIASEIKLLSDYNKTENDLRCFKRLSEALKLLEDIMGVQDTKDALTASIRAITKIENTFIHCREDLKVKEQELILAQSDYDDNFPEVCPLCGVKKGG